MKTKAISTESELRCLKETIKERDRQIEMIRDVSKDITSELDFDNLVCLVCKKAKELINADTVIVPFLHESRNSYTIIAALGEEAENILGSTFSIEMGMCGWVLSHEKPLIFGKDLEWDMNEKIKWEKGKQSALLVPLIGKKKIIGGLTALGKNGNESFTTYDLTLLSFYASQVSIAIENAELVKEQARIKAEHIKNLEAKVHERTIELSSKNNQLQESLNKLIKSQHEKDLLQRKLLEQQKLAALGTITAGVAHEIRNPLNLILGFAPILEELSKKNIELLNSNKQDKDTIMEANNSQVLNLAKKISNHGKRLDTISSQMMGMSRKQSYLSLSSLESCLESSLNMSNYLMETTYSMKVDIKKDYRELDDFVFSSEEMEQVFINILNNSYFALAQKAEASNNDYSPSLELKTWEDHDFACVNIRDNGAGIPSNIIDRVFDPFFTSSKGSMGTGLGLHVSLEIVQRHDGDI